MAKEYFENWTVTPDRSLEPTAVGACSSAIVVPVMSRRWFFTLCDPHLLRSAATLLAFVANQVVQANLARYL